MLEFQERRKIRKVLYSPWMAFILLVITALLIRSVWNLYNDKYVISRAGLQKTESELASISARSAELIESIASISTERGREEIIRETYQVTRPGEVSLQIIDNRTASAPEIMSVPKLTWWQRFVRMIE